MKQRLARAVLVVLCAAMTPAHAATPIPGDAPDASVIALRARDLRNGWGICGRPGTDATIAAYAAMMDRIGTRDIRSSIMHRRMDLTISFTALRAAMAASGITDPVVHVTALVIGYLNDPDTRWEDQQAPLLDLARAGALRAIEGPNELNNHSVGTGTHGPEDLADRTGPADYPANYTAWAQTIAAFRKANMPVLGHVPIIAPSIASGRRADYARLPDVSALVDAGNIHFYAGGGREPSFTMPSNVAVGYFTNVLAWGQAAQRPGGPMWMTESGASTSGNYARDGVSQARYLANQFFDFFAAGGQRMFYYQLIDGSSAPGDSEGNFGLFHHDGTPKPAAIMLGNLKHLLSIGRYDDPRNANDAKAFKPAFDASALHVSGVADAARFGRGTLVLNKSDGSTMIAIWNEPIIDDRNGHSLVPDPTPVSVDFGSVQTYSIHDLLGPAPLTGATPGGKPFDTGRTTTVMLQGSPILIELRPPGH